MDEIIQGFEWFVGGLSDFARSIGEAVEQLPVWFSWLPSVLVVPLVGVFATVVIVRILK